MKLELNYAQDKIIGVIMEEMLLQMLIGILTFAKKLIRKYLTGLLTNQEINNQKGIKNMGKKWLLEPVLAL